MLDLSVQNSFPADVVSRDDATHAPRDRLFTLARVWACCKNANAQESCREIMQGAKQQGTTSLGMHASEAACVCAASCGHER